MGFSLYSMRASPVVAKMCTVTAETHSSALDPRNINPKPNTKKKIIELSNLTKEPWLFDRTVTCSL